jgi:hypothetical protein
MGAAPGRHHSLFLDQLTEERAKKGSLEQRGIVIISTSGTLVAIVFVTLATRNPAVVPPATVVSLLVVALGGLVAATAAGLLVNAPARMPVIEIAEQTGWDRVDADSCRAVNGVAFGAVKVLMMENQAHHRRLLICGVDT